MIDQLVTVVIVTYNSSQWISRCLEHLAQSTLIGVRLEVIVVDNASTDDTLSVLKEQGVPYFVNTENRGFASAVNRGVELGEGTWILLLNPDCLVTPTAITNAIAFAASEPAYGIVGGRNLTPDGGTDPSSCWGLPTRWSALCFATGLSTLLRGNRIFDPESLGKWERDDARQVPMVSGAFLLMRRALWDGLGGMDDTFWLYGEDADLAARALAMGYLSAITPEAVVHHASGASSADHASKMVRVLAGKVTYARKHLRAQPGGRLVPVLLESGALLRSAASRVLRRRTAWTEVWARRSEWKSGYLPTSSGS